MTRALTLFALLLCSQAHAAGMLWANQQQTSEMAVWFVPGANGTLSGATLQTVTSGASCSSVTAVPGDHCHFVNWTRGGAAYSTANPLTVTNVTESMSLTANFAIDTYLITYMTDATYINGSNTEYVSYGGTGSLKTAGVSLANYHFVGWYYYDIPSSTLTGLYSTDTQIAVSNVTSTVTLMAHAEMDAQYTVNFVARANGSISGDTSQTLFYGEDCSAVTAVPDAHYHFNGWSGNYDWSNTLTVTNVTDDMTIYCDFSIDILHVYFYSGSHGHVVGDTVQEIPYGGDTSSVSAVADTGYHFVNWTGTFTVVNNPASLYGVTYQTSLTANFQAN